LRWCVSIIASLILQQRECENAGGSAHMLSSNGSVSLRVDVIGSTHHPNRKSCLVWLEKRKKEEGK